MVVSTTQRSISSAMASRLEEEAPNQIGNGGEDQNKEETWQKRDREYLLIVVTFMATVAFQAGVSPPGGVWQQDDKNSSIVAGTSIMATKFPAEFTTFVVGVTVCMIVSMLQFIVLFVELPSDTPSLSRKYLYYTLFFALGSMLSSYVSSVKAYTPESMRTQTITVLALTIGIGVVLVGISLFKQKIQQKCMR
ncbi:uncharacterized protein LOC111452618 [Cucurbita moschata]|uniref:Uncharacterized protein LOC111452618 n=1 Tax=Cucurbita moschata TaxID=3662 RepID=A0A6J1GBC1_CUCMO|nr:uncharacterized protein LOC111452618 [Cucurbita moschata]